MTFVAVTTVRDRGAAEVARETLEAQGIPVELKPLGVNPYLGGLPEIEVRVPTERLRDAEAGLRRLSEEIELPALAQAAEAPAPVRRPSPPAAVKSRFPTRPPSRRRALRLGLTWPLPVSCYAAGWTPLGAALTLPFAFLILFGLGTVFDVFSGHGVAILVGLAAIKLLDFGLAALFAKESHGAQS